MVLLWESDSELAPTARGRLAVYEEITPFVRKIALAVGSALL